ncbi:hypothetical protein [Planomonospora venezuelensis]|uniref:Uncharacterized protein n=1 Tax=Planomonospora venezuelensis TaxID=1999 RepID=A0A841CV82_PLAVE|nr:hypothetical protein [Planomonospora venezuelensis]MBB5961781.1 hypothetical protein [Planomonospora venezuelensis]GIN04983.1 hypothetical protein Pve01_66410 [Planomonospora venezuelensis]
MTPQSDEDEVWRQIVASFNDTSERDPADQPWPDSENLPAGPSRRVVRTPDGDGHPSADDGPAGADRADGEHPDDEDPDGGHRGERPRRGHPEDEYADGDDEGHYVPPPPPPLPKTDTTAKIAWLALFGGPAYLLVTAMAGWTQHGWALFTAIAAFIGGFVALVVRMGDGPPNDSGWDDGAVI